MPTCGDYIVNGTRHNTMKVQHNLHNREHQPRNTADDETHDLEVIKSDGFEVINNPTIGRGTFRPVSSESKCWGAQQQAKSCNPIVRSSTSTEPRRAKNVPRVKFRYAYKQLIFESEGATEGKDEKSCAVIRTSIK